MIVNRDSEQAVGRAAATMKDIARLSGVSRVTVSAVLNAKPGVSEKTRNKVLKVIREHGLHHSLIARSLMGHFSQMFGVIVPDINNPFYTDVIAGFLGEMKGRENHIICHPTDDSHEDEVRTIGTLMGYDLGGYLLASAQKGDSYDHVRRIIEAGRPLVSIGTLPGLDTHSVDFDDRTGAKEATDYLVNKGHRNIVCLSGWAHSESAKERVLGFVESLLEHGVSFDDSMVVRTDGHFEGGYKGALSVLRDRDPRPTALLCFNDVVAMGAYRAVHELGLHIPDDVSIVGFDDIEIAKVLGPPLTTVSISASEIGRAAARILIAAGNGELRGRIIHKTITTKLIERGSVRSL